MAPIFTKFVFENGNVAFRAKKIWPSLRGRHVIYDDQDDLVLTVREKRMGDHCRYEAYDGEKEDIFDVLPLAFHLRKTGYCSIPQTGTDLHMVVEDEDEGDPEYNIKGTWFERSCQIYDVGNNMKLVAEVRKTRRFGVASTKDKFELYVQPKFGEANMVAVVIIMYEMYANNINEEDCISLISGMKYRFFQKEENSFENKRYLNFHKMLKQ